MNTDPDLPPHLRHIGRQLTATAHQLKASDELASSGYRSRAWLTAGPVLAGAVAAAVLIATHTGTHLQPPQPQTLATGTGHHGGHARQKLVPLADPTAAKVLRRAAFVALQSSSVTPQPDQFIYTKTEDSTGQITQSWFSVDGARTSIIDHPGNGTPTTIPGCVNGHRSSRTLGQDGKPLSDFLPKSVHGKPITLTQAAKYFGGKIPAEGPIVTTSCTAQPAFFPDMPTESASMLAYLVKVQLAYPAGTTSAASTLNDVAKNVGYVLDTDYLTPAQQAALYQFLATTPGIALQHSVTDVAGRPGIGVRWTFEGSSATLIFDPSTYQYLGLSTIGTAGQAAGEALLQTAIVDAAGQQPEPPPSASVPGQT